MDEEAGMTFLLPGLGEPAYKVPGTSYYFVIRLVYRVKKWPSTRASRMQDQGFPEDMGRGRLIGGLDS